MKSKLIFSIITSLILGTAANAHGTKSAIKEDLAIVDSQIAEKLQLPVIYSNSVHNLAVAKLSGTQKATLSKFMHERGRCGGYEIVDLPLKSEIGPFRALEQTAIENLFRYMPKQQSLSTTNLAPALKFDVKIAEKVKMVSADNLKESVEWISSYPTRRHDTATKNDHVTEMKRRLTAMAQDARFPVEIELVSHSRTQQNTLRARIVGSEKPEEIVVLGAHFDSINQSFFGVTDAPGADDDASGSANLVEIFRILLTAEQPKRSVEFFWYAAEEVGLVGSSEVATQYRAANKNVVGALQLDMTLHPGEGELTMVFMTDFTNPELTAYAVELNNLYVKANVLTDRCGYGCSDHASWHRQGYPAIMPFEAKFNTMNKNIHTVRDVINPQSSFKHSAAFTKLGVAFAMAKANE